MPNPWIEWLQDMLCEMYEIWGGDCDDLYGESGIAAACAAIRDEFTTHGVSGLSAEAQGDLGTATQAMLNHLDNSANTLSQSENQCLDDLGEDILAALA